MKLFPKNKTQLFTKRASRNRGIILFQLLNIHPLTNHYIYNMIKISKILPPAAAPLSISDIFNGIKGLACKHHSIEQLSKSVCNEYQSKHAFFVSSGKAAITLSLLALKEIHPERNTVIIPSFNCYSVPSAIVKSGLSVLPCDINPETLFYDEYELKNLLKRSSKKILAILGTHFWGLPFDISRLKTFTHEQPITIIEDAAQAMGSRYKGIHAGALGDIGIFSLSRGKAISAGEGGIIITNNSKIAKILTKEFEKLPDYNFMQIFKLVVQSIALSILIHPSLFWIPKMMPFLKIGETVFEKNFSMLKLSGFQAGLLQNWKRKSEWLLSERTKRVMIYNCELQDFATTKLLPKNWFEKELSCIRYPIIIENKNQYSDILSESDRRGLGISPTYPGTINSIKEINLSENLNCNNAQFLVDNVLTLPCHPLVAYSDIRNIIKLVKTISS